jgi:hypothetical protein
MSDIDRWYVLSSLCPTGIHIGVFLSHVSSTHHPAPLNHLHVPLLLNLKPDLQDIYLTSILQPDIFGMPTSQTQQATHTFWL